MTRDDSANIAHLIFVAVWLVLLLYKLRHLWANRRSPRQWAICAAILFPITAMTTAAPAVAAWMDRTTGVSGLSILLLAYSAALTSASWLTLALFFRHPAPKAWTKVRWVLVAYGLDIATATILFSISDMSGSHLGFEFWTYHLPRQTTAFFFFLCYHLPLTAGILALGWWCVSWSRSDDYADLPWLRRGVLLFGTSCAVTGTVFLLIGANITALRFGTSALGGVTRVSLWVMLLMNVGLFPLALLLPVLGPRWPAVREWVVRWRSFFVLRSLHRALRHVSPQAVVVTRERRRDPHHRVRRMVMELSDWQWVLAPLFTSELGERVERLGREAGLTGVRLEAAVEAAQLSAAAEAWRLGARPESGPGAEGRDQEGGEREGWGRGEGTAGGEVRKEGERDGTRIDAEIAWWLHVTRAYRRWAVDGLAEEVSGAGAKPGTRTPLPASPDEPCGPRCGESPQSRTHGGLAEGWARGRLLQSGEGHARRDSDGV